jgi:hypothetical protein
VFLAGQLTEVLGAPLARQYQMFFQTGCSLSSGPSRYSRRTRPAQR